MIFWVFPSIFAYYYVDSGKSKCQLFIFYFHMLGAVILLLLLLVAFTSNLNASLCVYWNHNFCNFGIWEIFFCI